jgi:hypothetical protein
MDDLERDVMPAEFAKQIHQALKSWHASHDGESLDTLLLARQLRAANDSLSVRLISNQVLIAGLDDLKQVDPAAAELLQRRFLNKETAREIAYRFNMSEDVIYQQQRVALAGLTRLIWRQEMALRERQAQRLTRRLEPPTYTRLFGVAELLADVRARLENTKPPWILSLEGMGGVGKTALSDLLARNLAQRVHFQEIAWISVRQRLFRLSSGVETSSTPPSLSLLELIDRLIDQFELRHLKRQSDAEKLLGVKAFLKAQPCLIIVDNLESLADYRVLVAQLRDLTNPSKFVITTRYSVRGESGVYIMRLPGLSYADTLHFIRYEATQQGLHELAAADDGVLASIYDLTRGNPLATKLVVGQVHTFALTTVLERLSGIADHPDTELLDFLYADAWSLLDQKQRQVLKAMLLTPAGGGQIEHIAASASLDMGETVGSLQRLAILSLVNITGGLSERRYALHHLMRTFVARQSEIEP